MKVDSHCQETLHCMQYTSILYSWCCSIVHTVTMDQAEA